MEKKQNNDQPEAPVADAQQAGEAKPASKTWQEMGKKILYSIRDWFLKLSTSFKIIVIIFIVAILILIVLAYLGIFGQEVASLMKQLVNKILEQVKAKK